jgi:hypothetical protein
MGHSPGQYLYTPGQAISHAVFPIDGLVALLQTLSDGTSIELALVGREGLLGMPLILGGRSTPVTALVVSAGLAWSARSRGHLPRLPEGSAHRQRPGVHQPGVHGLGQRTRHSPHPDPARQTHAERLHRELQRQVPGRASERARVRDLVAGKSHRHLAAGLQRGQAAQQRGTHAAGPIRRVASPARWPMQLDHLPQLRRSTNLATSDFLASIDTAVGGRSDITTMAMRLRLISIHLRPG